MKKDFYLVGGAVRDILMKRIPRDKDYVAVGYTGNELLEMGFTPIDADFPVFHNEHLEEVALARREKKSGDGYRGFETDTSDVTLEEDLLRRDLTINSIAMASDGNFIDPYGGIKDIENKILRHTSDAFFEDPLRVLRLCRFQCQFPDFRIHEDTLRHIRKLNKPLELTPERVFKEMNKALDTDYPSLFFRTLMFIDERQMFHVFPELLSMKYCIQKPVHHAEGDVFLHSMMVLDECCKITQDPRVRYASMYHDIAKPASDFNDEGFHKGHDSLELVEPELKRLKENYKLPNKWVKTVRQGALYHMRLHKLKDMKNSTIAKMFQEKQFPKTEEELKDLLVISVADARGRITIGKKKSEPLAGPIIQAFNACKAYTPKYEIEKYKESHDGAMPNVETIQQWIHKYYIQCVKAYLRPFL